jgi:hypothetical protein
MRCGAIPPRVEFVRRALKRELFPERPRVDELPFGIQPVIDGNGTVPFTFVGRPFAFKAKAVSR